MRERAATRAEEQEATSMRGPTIRLAGIHGVMREMLYESATTRVFRVAHSGKDVICKESLRNDAAQGLQHEAAMVARLSAVAGVVRLASAGLAGGLLALADDAAPPLARRLADGPLEIPVLLRFAASLARTLAGVHRAGVIHRDINPANILFKQDGTSILIDFDLAVATDQPAGPPAHDGFVGTLGYLAPEQSGRTALVADHRADLYAFGATLYEAATGRPPFEGTDVLQLVHDHLVREPEPPSRVDSRIPPQLSRIVLRLLAKAPDDRYQSAEGLLHDLLRLQADLERGEASPFELGQRDFRARIAPPPVLIGREAELEALRGALADAQGPQRRAVLVEGVPGVGKSALMQELKPLAARAGGWFVHGKFEQYQQDAAAAGALTQCLRALARLVLALPRDEMAAMRSRIQQRIGRGTAWLARLSPEFAVLLGQEAEGPDGDPRQAELQVQQVFVDLLGAVAAPEHPLVIVLDDLQWAGAMPLRVIDRIMAEPGLPGLLVVGAYRQGEVAGSPLAPALDRWREGTRPALVLAIGNLRTPELGELLARMLRLEPAGADELAHAVGALTGGNPFDTVEMINALRRDGVLALGEAGWHWDDAAIRHFIGRGNVVDLLAARIARLAPASRLLVETVAGIGSAVPCALLASAMALGEDGIRERALEPVEDGLLIAEREGGRDILRLRHDRVQHAVLAGLDAAERGRRHLTIARRLAADPAWQQEAAQQYFACLPQVHERGELRRAADLFRAYARELAGMADFSLAERYLDAASALVAALADPADAALRWDIDAQRHAALYSLGRLAQADACHAQVRAGAPNALAEVEPACLQMRSLDMRGQMKASIELGLDMLRRLGLEVPAHFADAGTAPLDGIEEWVRQDARLDPATRPQIRDARLLAVAKVLGRALRSALVSFERDTVTWLLLACKDLWARHGPCPELAACLGRMSGMLISVRGDFRGAYAIARHVLQVGEALGYAQTAEARFIFATYACHWFEPVEHAYAQLAHGYESVQANGDASFACYVHLVLFTTLVEVAPAAHTTLDEIEEGLALCRRTGNLHAAALHASLRQCLRALGGLTDPAGGFEDAQFSEAAFLSQAGALPFVRNSYAECRAMHALVMGEGEVLSRTADLGMAHLANLAGYYMTVYAHFFVALARAWEIRAAPSHAATAARLEELDRCRTWMAARAADQPYNYSHLLRLMEAERAWAVGDMWKAAEAFDAAVSQAEARACPWHRAVITERAGLFQLERGLARAGRALLAEACGQYEAWGAAAKVRRMRETHDFLREAARALQPSTPASAGRLARGSSSVSPDALDLLGVLRASQALSSETSLERVTDTVTQVLSALTGATRVLLLSWHDEQWWFLAQGEPTVALADAVSKGAMPLSVFDYAQRTGETLVVDDAAADDRFARDPYFASVAPCSLLAVPIAGQAGSRAILLLENRHVRAAFHAERLEAVMLIAGQLAVSLSNAQLYEGLEQRVRARTMDLQRMQSQLVDTARRAGKAEIANNVLHNVGNVLNSINVSASVVRRSISESRAAGLERVAALLHEHRHDLPAFMATDPRGLVLVDYLTELAGVLGTERRDVLADLDRLTQSVDHIAYVVATQQSHAGPSSVLETVDPRELVDEALRLAGDSIDACGASVVRRYEDVPDCTLDCQRLLQVLVNLIRNAAQAMDNPSCTSRRITVGAGLGHPDATSGMSTLRITVQDEGEGIAPENRMRLFSHGFTTRLNGHGFGLHSSALAVMEMGGTLTAHSEGPGRGALFTLDLPLRR